MYETETINATFYPERFDLGEEGISEPLNDNIKMQILNHVLIPSPYFEYPSTSFN